MMDARLRRGGREERRNSLYKSKVSALRCWTVMASIEPCRRRKTRAAGLSCSGELTFRTGRKMDPIVSRVVAVRIESLAQNARRGCCVCPVLVRCIFAADEICSPPLGSGSDGKKPTEGTANCGSQECELDFFLRSSLKRARRGDKSSQLR